MTQFAKHFSLPEAREWLPELRKRFQRIHALYGELQELQEDYKKVQELIRANGHAPKDTGFEPRAHELQTLVREIVEAGIEVKDIGRGLVDFPYMRGGEEVFLCWELEDEDIGYWHTIESGYAGRMPL